MLHAFQAKKMECQPASTVVNDPKHELPRLLERETGYQEISGSWWYSRLLCPNDLRLQAPGLRIVPADNAKRLRECLEAD